MAQGKKITKSIYNCIKTLLAGGATNKEISEYLMLSEETIRRVKKSENYEDYLSLSFRLSGAYYKKMRLEKEAAEKKAAEEEATRMAEAAKKAEAEKKAAEKKATEDKEYLDKVYKAFDKTQEIVAPPAMNNKPISMTIQATHFMETKLDVVIDLLKVMNNKLGAIIDDLYGTGKKDDGNE